MRSWMLRRENRQFCCICYLGATDSLHYMDSCTAHICTFHWEPCILLESILFWSVLRNLHKDADLVTLGIIYSRPRNWSQLTFWK
jgi:hypothetical protein